MSDRNTFMFSAINSFSGITKFSGISMSKILYDSPAFEVMKLN